MLYALVFEKENKIKNLLKTNGMDPVNYWVSYFIFYFLVLEVALAIFLVGGIFLVKTDFF